MKNIRILSILSAGILIAGCSDDSDKPIEVAYPLHSEMETLAKFSFSGVVFEFEKSISFEPPIKSVQLFEKMKIANSEDVSCALYSEKPAATIAVGEKMQILSTEKQTIKSRDHFDGFRFEIESKDKIEYLLDCANLDSSTSVGQFQLAVRGILRMVVDDEVKAIVADKKAIADRIDLGKNLGLALRIYASDNENNFPDEMSELINELGGATYLGKVSQAFEKFRQPRKLQDSNEDGNFILYREKQAVATRDHPYTRVYVYVSGKVAMIKSEAEEAIVIESGTVKP